MRLRAEAFALLLVPTVASASAVDDLRSRSPGPITARVVAGSVAFARMPGGVDGFDNDARGFVEAFGDVFGVDAAQARLVASRGDALGHTSVEFGQRFHGLEVVGASMRLHFDPRGRLIVAQAAWVPTAGLGADPGFDVAEAESVALDHVEGSGWVGNAALVIFDIGLLTKGGSDPKLAYAVDVGGPGVRQTVYVDAHAGTPILAVSHIHTVLSRVMYEAIYAAGSQVWEEADGPYAGGDADMQGLIDFTEDSYEIFNNVAGGTFESYDGDSAPMEAVLRATELSCPNANWDGTSTNYCDGLAADDVVGHEWAHAYTRSTHDLIYAYEPGALNESFSDIFGESMDLINGAGTDTPGDVRTNQACSGDGDSVRWLVGEDTVGLGVIRDMWSPPCENQPGRMSGGGFVCNDPGEFFDNGGVHFNSGIPNHAYALLVDGGTFNTVDVPAIGMAKALAIYWRAMTVYQGVVSGFADHADALEASCADLVGTDVWSPVDGSASGEVIAVADCDAVADAILATELRDPSPCITGSLFETEGAPTLCAAGAMPTTVLEEMFEGDLSAWTLSNAGVSGDYTPRDWVLRDTLPDERAGQAVFAEGDLFVGDCDDDNQAGEMHLDSPTFDVTSSDVVLGFWHWLATEPYQDGGNLELSVNGGGFVSVPGSAFTFNPYNATLERSNNPMSGEPAFSGANPGLPTGTWVESHADLSGLVSAGDSVVLRFDFGVNACNGLFGWYVDDLRVLQCSADAGTSTTGQGSSSGDAPGSETAGTVDPPMTTSSTSSSTTPPTTMPPTGGDPSGGTTSSGEDAAPAGEDGCGCRQSGAAGWLALLLLLALRRRKEKGLVGPGGHLSLRPPPAI